MFSNLSESHAPVMVTTAQVAKMAGVCLRTVRYWEAKGLMPARTMGYRRMYVWTEVKDALRVYIFNKAYVVKAEDKFLMFGRLMEAIENDAFDFVPAPLQDVQPPTA